MCSREWRYTAHFKTLEDDIPVTKLPTFRLGGRGRFRHRRGVLSGCSGVVAGFSWIFASPTRASSYCLLIQMVRIPSESSNEGLFMWD